MTGLFTGGNPGPGGEAAKDFGKSLLPRGNQRLVRYTQRARDFYGFTLIEQVPETLDTKDYIEGTVGISVEYVDTIDDVLQISTVSS